MSAGAKTDNRAEAKAAKIDLRRRVLDAVRPARVFEGFCGLPESPVTGVWADAAEHVGCDIRYAWGDPRKRFVGDVHRVLRAIDLRAYNVFDFDAYGSPWMAMLILAHRRTWAPGEVGAVILTDGTSMKTRYGSLPRAMAELLGHERCAPKDQSQRLHRDCLLSWLSRSGVKARASWSAFSPAGRKGAQAMVYSATVFEGRSGR